MWTIMTLLALWHMMQVRRTNRTLMCTEYIGPNDDENEFKTGKHTYARWSNADDANEVADEDVEGIEEIGEVDYVPITDEEIDEDEDEDDESDESSAENPLLDALKKVYTAVFFYGLEEPKPNPLYSNKINRMNRSNQRRAMPSSRKLKSPFFTKGEQKAYFLVLNDKEYPIEGSAKDRSTPPRRSSSASAAGGETIYAEDDDYVAVQEYPQASSELEELDQQLRNYSEKLKNLDRKIVELQATEPNEERLSALQSQRDQVLSAIEDTQIQYVTLKSLESE